VLSPHYDKLLVPRSWHPNGKVLLEVQFDDCWFEVVIGGGEMDECRQVPGEIQLAPQSRVLGINHHAHQVDLSDLTTFFNQRTDFVSDSQSLSNIPCAISPMRPWRSETP
jgi:hypothetical protein